MFKIDDYDFYPSQRNDHTMTIASTPKDYLVRWDESNPTMLIQSVLQPGDLLVIDENVSNAYYPMSPSHPSIHFIDATEDNKTIESALEIIDRMDVRGFTKANKLVVVGGGITQDIAAFASATYKRGIPWTFIPTTLLAQADSCIGGKCGLNYHAKNQLALFSAPTEVIINPHFLKTLDRDAMDSGMGEIAKLHILGGRESFDYYKRHPIIKNLILGALAIKKEIIEEDEFELGVRKSLNYGHTIGHAIETLSDYSIPHGVAVSLGMIIVNELHGTEEAEEIKRELLKLVSDDYLSILKSLNLDDLEPLLKKDKKTKGDKLTLVVVDSLGETIFRPTTLDQRFIDRIKLIVEAL